MGPVLAALLTLMEDEEERRVFTDLYQRYYDKLAAVAARYFPNDPAAAEDAVHNAFVKVIRNFEKIKEIPGNQLPFWLVSIVKNESISLLRRRRPTVPFEDWADWEQEAEMGADLDYGRVLDLIRRMPETYRAVLELRFVEELEYREIARALHLNEGTVRSRVSRGRALLVEKLREEGIVP